MDRSNRGTIIVAAATILLAAASPLHTPAQGQEGRYEVWFIR